MTSSMKINSITEEGAPCFMPEYAWKMSDNFPALLRTHLVHRYMSFSASNKHAPTPNLVKHFRSCTRDTLSNAFDKSKNPINNDFLCLLTKAMIIRKVKIGSSVLLPF